MTWDCKCALPQVSCLLVDLQSWQAGTEDDAAAGSYDLPMWEGSHHAGSAVPRLPSFGLTPGQLDALWDNQGSPVFRPSQEARPVGAAPDSRQDDWARIPAHCRRPRVRRGLSGAPHGGLV